LGETVILLCVVNALAGLACAYILCK